MLSSHQEEIISRSPTPSSTTKQAAVEEFESGYPLLQQWRLLVDGCLYAIKPRVQFIPDAMGWRRYENREPHSIAAFFSAWQFCLRQLKSTPYRKDLTVDFILKLHLLVTQDVKEAHGCPGKFRKGFSDVSFSLGNAMLRITEAGAQDLAMSLRENGARILYIAEDNNFSLTKITKACFLRVRQEVKEEDKKIVAIREVDLPLKEAAAHLSNADKLSNDYFLVSFQPGAGYQVQKLMRHSDTTNLASIIYRKIQQQGILYLGTTISSDQKLYSLVKDILTYYNNSIAALTDDQAKLLLIGKTIERLERIHPFSDGNGRVFVNLLLNYLLLQEGFPPATLFEPNVFDAFGYHVEVIAKGILNTQAVYAGKSNLFGFTMAINEMRDMNKIIEQSLIKGLLHYLSDIKNMAKACIETLTAFEDNPVFFSNTDELMVSLREKISTTINSEEFLEMLNTSYFDACIRHLPAADLIEIQHSLATIKTVLTQKSAAFIGPIDVMVQAIDDFSFRLKIDSDEKIFFSNMPVKDWDQFAANQYTLFGQHEQEDSAFAAPGLKDLGNSHPSKPN